MYKRLLLISPCLFIIFSTAAQRAEDYVTVAEDGAWCWFSDPRAVWYKGIHERTYTGFVTSGGDIMVASKDHSTGDEAKTLVYPDLQADDHVNPSLLMLPDGRLMIMVKHGLNQEQLCRKKSMTSITVLIPKSSLMAIR